MKVQFKQWSCIAKGEHYSNGRKAIELIDSEDGSPIARATVNLPNDILDDNHVFIKNYSENEGMEDALINAGIIKGSPVYQTNSGHVQVNVFELTEDAIKNLW